MTVESRPRAEPATRKGRQTRDRILAVAAELIYQRGEAEVGIRDVEQAAGISGSQMTHYFRVPDDPLLPGPHALIRAVIARRAREVIDFLSQPEIEGLDSLARLRVWARMTVERQRATGTEGGCVLGSLVAQFSERDEVRARRSPRASTPGSAAWPRAAPDPSGGGDRSPG